MTSTSFLTPEHFTKLYLRMLEAKLGPSPRYKINSQGGDGWGVEITRTAITGVSVWHIFARCEITLGIKSAEMQKRVPDGALPPGARAEPSSKGWLQYRWSVGPVDFTRYPHEQPTMTEAIRIVVVAFDWFTALGKGPGAAK